nr:MAG TPA: hypothetical protein [Ackermannviridae sp.]
MLHYHNHLFHWQHFALRTTTKFVHSIYVLNIFPFTLYYF